NGDFSTARKAFQAAVDLGEFSVYARADDEVGLVKAVAETDGPEEALKVLDMINQSRRTHGVNHANPGWRIDLTYGQMLLANEEAAKAKESIKKARDAYLQEQRDSADPAALALAKCCYRVGMIPEAKDLMNRIVKENHDREDIISAVRLMYGELGMTDLGEDLIDSARRAVVDINNRGVTLAKEGKLDEAITLLTKASDELPGNLTISLNVLQAALSQIRFSGRTAEREFLLEQYVSRAERINAGHPKFVKLREKILLLRQDSEQRMQA
ncbi:MAG: tetratricopeptide repeat protein, partial [Gammaproteobacteria bacterium]